MLTKYDKKKNTVLVEMTPQELALQVVLNGSTSWAFVEEKHMNGNQNVTMDMLQSEKNSHNKTGCYVKLKSIMDIVKAEGGYGQ